MTGFTVEGEVVLKVLDKLTSDGVALVVDAVTKAAADYSSPMHPFDDYSMRGVGSSPEPTRPVRAASTAALQAFDALPTAQVSARHTTRA